MKIPPALVSAALTLALACSTPPAPQSTDSRPPPNGLPEGGLQAAQEIGEGFLSDSLRELSSDRMEGRGPGSRGDTLARQSIAVSLEASGLQPGAADGTWACTPV